MKVHEINGNIFIKKVLENIEFNRDTSIDILHELSIKISDDNLIAIAFDLSQTNCLEITLTDIIDMLSVGIENLYWVKLRPDVILAFGNLKGTKSQLLQINNSYQFATKIRTKHMCSIAISTVHERSCALNEACKEAISALSLQFFKGSASVIFPMLFKDEKSDIEEIEKSKHIIASLIARNELDLAREQLKYVSELFDKLLIKDIDYIYTFYTIIVRVIYAKSKKESSIFENDSISQSVRAFKYHSELYDYVINTLNELATEYSKTENTGYSFGLKKALEYIDENHIQYMTIKEIASYLDLEPDFISALFKTESEQSFTTHLISKRMESAEHLLKHTDMKIFEVAESVGYPNLSYFSKLFKKYIGVLPDRV